MDLCVAALFSKLDFSFMENIVGGSSESRLFLAKRFGFTLIELLVVIAIIAILAAMDLCVAALFSKLDFSFMKNIVGGSSESRLFLAKRFGFTLIELLVVIAIID